MPKPARASDVGRLSSAPRHELAERLLSLEDRAQCAELAVGWLVDRGACDQALCLAADADAQVLTPLAARSVRWKPGAIPVDLRRNADPLVVALNQPTPLRLSSEKLERETGVSFSHANVWAMPLRRPESELSLGLLLCAGEDMGPLDDRVRWAAEFLAVRLLCFDHRRVDEAARRYRRQAELLQAICDAVTDPILATDPDGRILAANSVAEALFSAVPEDSDGRRRAVALNNMLFSSAMFTAPSQSKSGELTLADPDEGEDIAFELLSNQLGSMPGTVAVLRNVTDLRRAGEELADNFARLRVAEARVRADRDRLDLIINSVVDPILVANPEGKIELMNPPAARLFTADAAHSDKMVSRVRANDAFLSSFLSGLFLSHEWTRSDDMRLVDPHSGRVIPMRARAASVLTHTGEMAGVVITLQDRTQEEERTHLYEQIKRHSEELQQRVQEATAELAQQNELLRRQATEVEQAARLKSHFLVTMSHELRTPLNAIIGYSYLLLKQRVGVLPDRVAKIEKINANAQRLLALSNDVLDITRLDSGKMQVTFEEVDPLRIITEVMTELEPLTAQRKLTVRHHAAKDLPLITTDAGKVKQVLVNFMSNALKFTPKGSIELRARYHSDSDEVSMAVRDSGIGIAPEHQATVFDDFRQVTGPGLATTGTGLGLAICRRLAVILHGRVTLKSRPGHGSTFTLWLPRRRPDEDQEQARGASD